MDRIYKESFQKIRPSEKAIDDLLYRLEEPEMKTKNLLTKCRVIVLATACCLLFASVCYAATKIAFYEGHGPSQPQCTEYDALSDLTDDLNYNVVIPKSFTNGYDFANATLFNEAAKDDAGNTISEYKGLDVVYTNAKAEELTLSITPVLENGEDKDGFYDKTKSANGIDVQSASYTIKFVPPDYQKTEEDMTREANENFTISYGSDTIEGISYICASLDGAGVHYLLTVEDAGSLTGDELLDMASALTE